MMKKFIVKIMIFILPIILCGICMELLLRKLPNDYKYKKEYLDSHSNDIETLVLGSSHTFYGIDPIYFSNITFNAGAVSQKLNYDFKIFKKYQNSFKNLKTIVLPISYFTLFSGRLEDGSESWRVKNYVIYYDFNTAQSLTDFTEILSVKFNLNVRRLASFYIKGNSNLSCNKFGWGIKYKSENAHDLTKTGKIAALRHSHDIESIECQNNFKDNLVILNRFVEDCKEQNIKLILITPPAFETYRKNINIKQLDITTNTAKEIARNNNNCFYYNFMSDTTFIDKDFYDADHLSEIGARKLSIIMDKKNSLISR